MCEKPLTFYRTLPYIFLVPWIKVLVILNIDPDIISEMLYKFM
jgi:hypothetical protein